MTQTSHLHQWMIGSYRDHQERKKSSLVALAAVDCHQRHRGPYTAAGEIIRSLVPTIYQSQPDLILEYARTLLSMVPETKEIVLALAPDMEEIIGMDNAIGVPFTALKRDEGFHPGARTTRLAHGLVEFLLRYVASAAHENLLPYSIVFEHVDMADPLDQEFLAILLRRAKPEQLLITLYSLSAVLPEPLHKALQTYASMLEIEPSCEHTFVVSPIDDEQLARAYIVSNCTSDDPLEKLAYQHLSAHLRQQWHAEQAQKLEQTQQKSLTLGAIPYHYDHGYDHQLEGHKIVPVFLSACQYCTTIGYYQAVFDLAARGREIAQLIQDDESYWLFTKAMIISHLMRNELSEAEQLCYEIQNLTQNPAVLYFLGILYIRFYEEGKRDYAFARQQIQGAIERAVEAPVSAARKRANILFLENNTMALIELRSNGPEVALQMLTNGLVQFEKEAPEFYASESPILWMNKARVHIILGQIQEALQCYTTAIEFEPYVTDYYYARAYAFRLLGSYEEALKDYQQAILASPPYPEVYYNRACVLSLLGRDQEALDDYAHVLELDPSWIDARINRASIFYQEQNYRKAREEIENGFAIDACNAELQCTLGLIELEEQQREKAYASFTKALEWDPQLYAAWINRGILAFEDGRIDAAIGDFTQALSISTDALALSNRGLAYQTQGYWQEAIQDYTQALLFSPDDEEDILAQRDDCYQALAQMAHSAR